MKLKERGKEKETMCVCSLQMTQTAFLFHQFDCYHITEKPPSPSKGKLQDKKGGSRHVIRYCSREKQYFLSILLAWPYQTYGMKNILLSQ